MENRKWYFTVRKNGKKFLVKSIFDDEGTIDKTNNVIRVKSMNKKGLFQSRDMMNSINIPCRITGPNCDDSYYLTVSREDSKLFQRVIGFNHPKKKSRLEKILENQWNKIDYKIS